MTEITAPDIYFDAEFPTIYEKIDGGKTKIFNCECDFGQIRHSFLLREIPQTVEGNRYYDATTAYGYGGPIVTEVAQIEGMTEAETKKRLIETFEKEFARYCLENNIVSEFIRFHPLFNNAEDFKSVYEILHIRNTVGTDLKNYPDFFGQEYSKGSRNSIRQAINKGVTVEVVEKPENLDEFKGVYYATMDRNNADGYYYFDDEYFDDCIKKYRDNIVLVKAIYEDKIVAASFYFVWKRIAHMHLSGTLGDYLSLSPAYILQYGIASWAVEKGYEIIHHGGGKTNDSEDSLFKFKKKFGKNTEFPFCIGKRVWNDEVYTKLCELTGAGETEFFPAYRRR